MFITMFIEVLYLMDKVGDLPDPYGVIREDDPAAAAGNDHQDQQEDDITLDKRVEP